MKPFQIVLDTNVLISGLRSKRGAANALLQRLNDPRLKLHVSNALLLEYEELLRREQARLGLADVDVESLLDGFCTIGVQHYVSFVWRPTARDADDDFLVDLAVAAHADFVVTFNVRDLQPIEKYGIKVVTPQQILEILRDVK